MVLKKDIAIFWANLKCLKSNIKRHHKIRFFVSLFIMVVFDRSLLLQWDTVKIYIARQMFFVEPNLFKDFICNHQNKGMKYKVVCGGKISQLYIKYVKRIGLINKVILSQNKNHELFTESCYLGKENYTPYKGVIYNDCPKRKIIKGTCFDTYLCKQKDKIGTLKNFYNWLFEEFKTPNKNKVNGLVVDCHFFNFVVDDNENFHFVDRDVSLKQPIDKSYILYRSLKEPGLLDLYEYFLKYYKIKDKSDYYIKHRLLPFPQNNKNLKLAEMLNNTLLASVFCD